MNKIKLLMPILGIPTFAMTIAPLASCNCSGQNKTTITLSVKQLQLGVNETKQIQAKVSPAGSTITWKSNNKSIAKVDSKGNVTGVAGGTTTITATANGVNATCNVVVAATELTSIEITSQPTVTSYFHGDKLDLTGLEVTGHYNDGTSKVLDKTEYTTIPAEGDEMKISDDTKGTEQQKITVNCGSLTATTNDVTVTAAVAPLEFTANKDFTLSCGDDGKCWNGTLEYSLDGNNFQTWDGTTSIQTTNKKLYLRGSNNNYFAPTIYNATQFVFNEDEDLEVSCGDSDIRSLLNYSDVRKIRMSGAGFAWLFANCTALISTPKLTLTTISDYAYYRMFDGCENLISTCEVISATKHWENEGSESEPIWKEVEGLALDCYDGTFINCESLKNAPKLPATTMAENCYGGMFRNCSSLQNAPELPAMNLAKSCYSSMFQACSSLQNAPELPATTLAEKCYAYMFFDCTKLVGAPQLLAISLPSSCYYSMFYGCISLTKAPKLPATNLSYQCYQYMFGDCTNLKIAEEGDDSHKIFTCPAFAASDGPVDCMFDGTKGREGATYDYTPVAGTSYYWVEE